MQIGTILRAYVIEPLASPVPAEIPHAIPADEIPASEVVDVTASAALLA